MLVPGFFVRQCHARNLLCPTPASALLLAVQRCSTLLFCTLPPLVICWKLSKLCSRCPARPLLPGLELAQRLGFPISHQATLFSTPEDLEQLSALFAAHPYPRHRCYVRRGHGFFVLGRSVDEVRQIVEQEILPHLGPSQQ